jgi:hypothetical protein
VSRKKTVSNSNHSKKKATPGPKAERLKLQGQLERPHEDVLVREEASRRLAGDII